MKDIAVYGAGGFGCEVACLIHSINKNEPTWNFIGFFDDDSSLKGTKNAYGVVLGGRDDLNAYQKPLAIVIAIGNPQDLKRVAENIQNENIEFPNLIAPGTIILDEDSMTIGKGNIISFGCYLSHHIVIGDFNILNGFIPLGHDTIMGNYNVIMPSVNISGGVHIGDCNFLGVQSVVLQSVKIGNHVRLGANSVMMHHAKDGALYIGNPAKKTTF